jgi:peptide/nickel transport system ATP-binding protein
LPVISDFLNAPIVVEKSQASAENSIVSGNTEIILSVQNLSVLYPSSKNFFGKATSITPAVDNVSFDVRKNETVGLVGESGCGKTTLGRAILQLVKPDAGKILLNGSDLAAAEKQNLRSIRKNLQIVFQDPYGSLNPRLSIGDAILEPMKVHKMFGSLRGQKERSIDLLEKVNLKADMFNRYPHQFSGGQRQRICIARALALDPSFLIFDESVSALDVSVQAQVLNLINTLKKELNFTSIFISHDLSVVHYISDRILVMNKGRIIEEGTANQVYFHPRDPYTQQLIESIPGRKAS